MQKKLLDPAKDHMVASITKIFQDDIASNVTILTKLFESDTETSILTINNIMLKIEHASTRIGHDLRAYVNIEVSEVQKVVYLKHIYKQLEELYENYCGDDNKLDWERIIKDKGKKFASTFPLQDAIGAAKMVATGELEIE